MKEQFHTFSLGDFTCHSIYTSYFNIAPKYIFSSVAEEEYLGALSLEKGKVRIPILVLCVQTEEKNILIDTGLNITEGERKNRLVENLSHVNLTPEDITDIIITHGHNDHIGGVFDARGNIAFENARYWVATREQNFWGSEDALKTLGYLKSTPKLHDELRNKTMCVSEKKEIFPGIVMEPAYGHTPGHAIVRIMSNDEALVHIGDLAVHPLHISHPQWHVKPDVDQKDMEQSRAKIFAQAAEQKEIVFANHFAFPGLGRIKQGANGFFWEKQR